MQTILGSGGSIGGELARNLKEYTSDIRLVSRNPQKVNESDELMAVDLLDASNINEAVKGSTIVYVTIGFKYNLRAILLSFIERQITETSFIAVLIVLFYKLFKKFLHLLLRGMRHAYYVQKYKEMAT